jgi:hypothetical protein
MNVKSVFLCADLTEDIYMEQPPIFEKDGSVVCLLKKSLYDLKQAPMVWYEIIDQFFLSHGFKHCESYHCIYVLHVNGKTLTVALYVDDLDITRSNVNLILGLRKLLMHLR